MKFEKHIKFFFILENFEKLIQLEENVRESYEKIEEKINE